MENASTVGWSTKSRGGSFFLNQSMASSTAFFLAARGTMPGGRGTPARFVSSSMIGSSRYPRSGLFFLSQSTEFSRNFFFSIGVILLRVGNPVRLDNASIVGSSRSPGEGSFFLNQSMASLTAFVCASLGVKPAGKGFTARF